MAGIRDNNETIEDIMVGRKAACHQPVTDCHGLNAAAMREACANIADYAKTAACHTEDAHLLGYLYQIEGWAEAALSAPLRNCDVGTEREQCDRLESFCVKHFRWGANDNPCQNALITQTKTRRFRAFTGSCRGLIWKETRND